MVPTFESTFPWENRPFYKLITTGGNYEAGQQLVLINVIVSSTGKIFTG